MAKKARGIKQQGCVSDLPNLRNSSRYPLAKQMSPAWEIQSRRWRGIKDVTGSDGTSCDLQVVIVARDRQNVIVLVARVRKDLRL
jgi:hypothetical protein